MCMIPVVKWAGGKRQILEKLKANMPKQFNNYFEPFIGGGALFFYLMNNYKIKESYIFDINKEII